MSIITRHSAGGYRMAMASVLSPQESFQNRAIALRSAFVWADHALAEDYWYRSWLSLTKGRNLSRDAQGMLQAMARQKPKTIYPAEARDHDRRLAHDLLRSRAQARDNRAA